MFSCTLILLYSYSLFKNVLQNESVYILIYKWICIPIIKLQYSLTNKNQCYMGPGLWKSHFPSFAESCLESLYEMKCLTERIFATGSWCSQCLFSFVNQRQTHAHTQELLGLYTSLNFLCLNFSERAAHLVELPQSYKKYIFSTLFFIFLMEHI